MIALMVELDDEIGTALEAAVKREQRTKRAIVQLALAKYIAESQVAVMAEASPAPLPARKSNGTPKAA